MIPKYEVILSKDFQTDLNAISAYISEILLAPESADKIVDGILNVVESLSFMPERYVAVESPNHLGRIKRRASYGNFGIYYAVDKKKQKVYVIQVIHKGRNAKKLLRKA